MTIIPKPQPKTINSRTVIAEQQKYCSTDYNCDLKTNLVMLNLPSCDYGNFMSINVLICFSEGVNILNELLNNINFGFGSHMKIRNLLVYNA